MTRLKIVLVFISLLGLRWVSLQSPLPSSWTPESRVRFTATILEKPEQTDSQTIIRNGIWYIPIKGYAEIIPGSRVVFEGMVEPKIVLGNVVQIKMIDPEMTEVKHSRSVGALHSGSVVIALGIWRERWVRQLQQTLPEPMASLSAGILLGVKRQMPYEFYQQLVNTGTLHIVAASGFNVMIVASVLMKTFAKLLPRGWAIVGGVVGIVVYVLLSGASASVVRAGIMGSLTLMAYYLGRPAEARRLLWVTGAIMLLINPLLILDIGFQLSFAATAGLLYIEPGMQELQGSVLCKKPKNSLQRTDPCNGIQMILANYLYPTLAATIATLPIILWHFGRVSWISPLVNVLVLPIVPLIMGMCALTLIGGQVVAWLTYPLLAYMVWVIKLWG